MENLLVKIKQEILSKGYDIYANLEISQLDRDMDLIPLSTEHEVQLLKRVIEIENLKELTIVCKTTTNQVTLADMYLDPCNLKNLSKWAIQCEPLHEFHIKKKR